ncbi:uncharacterized protein MELLADRAFT_62476 [Melampsora larici-populina 98AG31]|uniref:Carbohydrate esterase family 16 protein n=1 Tax=Melampsora larici-populina (strain 98AG31 / pathotype 3-4-7) TaxID=747676 RepID=F4RJ39_MELLP|nr:uncharacterized protein MELLADRAFT_62476 [Melampsora larici-populina 98AG31]EGG07666.1 hypothetical protein MELLADRAFT_62476 [Melampsora larici-populina 98AG31]
MVNKSSRVEQANVGDYLSISKLALEKHHILYVDEIFAEFIVITIPPLELVPNSVQFASRSKNPLGSLDRVKDLTSTYNQGLMKLQSDKIRVLDIVPFWSDIASNPKEYGFAHVKKACLGGGKVCPNPVAYMYWDSLHPTTTMHEIIAKQVHGYLEKIV